MKSAASSRSSTASSASSAVSAKLPTGDLPHYIGGVPARTVAALLLILAAVFASGQTGAGAAPSLEHLLRQAMARDSALARLELAWRNSQLALAQNAAAKGLSIDIGAELDYSYSQAPLSPTPATYLCDEDVEDQDEKDKHPQDQNEDKRILTCKAAGASSSGDQSQGDYQSSLGGKVTIEADLPHPFGTLSASLPVTLIDELGVDAPTTSLSQPLAPLLGLDATESADLEAAHAVVTAERAIRTRVRALADELLTAVIAILELDKSEAQQIHQLSTIEDAITRMRIAQENKQSHAFQSSQFDLERMRRILAATLSDLDQARAALEDKSGARNFAALGEAALRLPAGERNQQAPAVADATVDLRASDFRIREHQRTHLPVVAVNAGYDWEKKAFSAGLNLSFTILDGGTRRLASEQLANNRASAEIALAQAREVFASALDQAERDIRDLEHNTWELRERRHLAALKLTETRAALAAGVATEADVAQAELDLALLELDAQIQAAERWQLKLQLDTLTDINALVSVTLR